MYHLSDKYQNPVNMNQVKKTDISLFTEAVKSLKDTGNTKARPSAGALQYGANKLPEFARFRAVLYFEGFLRGANNKFPSFDDYHSYQDKVKTPAHDESTGLEKLKAMCIKESHKKKYTSMVIYCAPHEPYPKRQSADYFYMINIFVPRDGLWIWRHPWKELKFDADGKPGFFSYENTKAANPGFNELGYPKYETIAQQNKLYIR